MCVFLYVLMYQMLRVIHLEMQFSSSPFEIINEEFEVHRNAIPKEIWPSSKHDRNKAVFPIRKMHISWGGSLLDSNES